MPPGGPSGGDSCPASLEVYRRKLAELDDCIGRLQEVRTQVAEQFARAEQARDELAAEAGGRAPQCELAIEWEER